MAPSRRSESRSPTGAGLIRIAAGRIVRRLDEDLHRPRLCAAIVDRLTFNGTIIETGTESYRLAQTKAKQQRG